MWTFFKYLTMGGLRLLSPHPIDISGEWTPLPLAAPVEALNAGASIEIEVTSVIPPLELGVHGQLDRMGEIAKRFPHGCIEAKLTKADGSQVLLSNTSETVTNVEAYTLLYLRPPQPLEQTFVAVALRSDCPVSKASVYWLSYRL